MEVILLERVARLGQMGDVVKVKDGFARNFLLPKKKALRATKSNREYFETQKHQLEAHNLEPKMTPFDPMAILDEVQRVVAGYLLSHNHISRVNLLAGNDQHLEIAEGGAGALQNPELIAPAHDGLFSSGTLGRYSKTLNSVYENKSADSEVAAD